MSTPKHIKERAFEFALRIVKLCQYLDKQPGVPADLGLPTPQSWNFSWS